MFAFKSCMYFCWARCDREVGKEAGLCDLSMQTQSPLWWRQLWHLSTICHYYWCCHKLVSSSLIFLHLLLLQLLFCCPPCCHTLICSNTVSSLVLCVSITVLLITFHSASPSRLHPPQFIHQPIHFNSTFFTLCSASQWAFVYNGLQLAGPPGCFVKWLQGTTYLSKSFNIPQHLELFSWDQHTLQDSKLSLNFYWLTYLKLLFFP